MAVKEIIKYPNMILNQKCKEVKQINNTIKQLITDLTDTLNNSDVAGVGLAAPQINVLEQVCIVRKYKTDRPNSEYKDYILINPKITSSSYQKSLAWEGCLSIPDTFGKVQRAKKIVVTYLDENFKLQKLKAEGMFARIIQHEIDHLNGILFTSIMIGKSLTEEELDRLYDYE